MPQNGYTLILVEPGLSPTEFHLAPSPQDVRSEKTALTTLTPLPGMSAYRESHGNGFETVILQGTFGAKTRQVGGIDWSGAEMFLAFRKGFWDRYLSLVGSADPVKQKTQMEFHNWDEDEHYYAEPIRFVSPRGHENRTFYRYEFTLQLYAPIAPKFTQPVVDKISLADQVSKFLKMVAEKLKAAGEWLSEKTQLVASWLHRNVLQPIADLVTALDTFVAGVSAVVNFLPRALNRLCDSISQTIEAMGDIVGDTLTETANALRNTRRALNRLRQAPELFIQSVNAGLDELSSQYYQLVQDGDSTAVQEEKLGGRNLGLMRQAQQISENNYQGAQRVTIRQGDTLPKMAVRYLGDASRWHEIALLNGIDDPDISSLAGQEILVPTIPGLTGTGIAGDLGDSGKIANATMSERLYGRDLRLGEQDGFLGFEFGANDDLCTVAGEANLVQAVTLKTRIAQGQLLEDPNFGLRRVVGKKATSAETKALVYGLQVAAQSDPRVEKAEVAVTREGNVTTANYTLYPVGVAGSRPISAVVGV